MTHQQYALFATLFDAVHAVDRAPASMTGREHGAGPMLQLHGNIAGESLRSWCTHGSDATGMPFALHESELEASRSDGTPYTWTCLTVLDSFGASKISVHLDDETPPEVAAPAPSPDDDFPF